MPILASTGAVDLVGGLEWRDSPRMHTDQTRMRFRKRPLAGVSSPADYLSRVSSVIQRLQSFVFCANSSAPRVGPLAIAKRRRIMTSSAPHIPDSPPSENAEVAEDSQARANPLRVLAPPREIPGFRGGKSARGDAKDAERISMQPFRDPVS